MHCKNYFNLFLFVVIENTNVCTYASSVLQKLCSQDWLREKCLRDNKLLFSPEGLLDPDMTDVQVRMFLKVLWLLLLPPAMFREVSATTQSVASVSARLLSYRRNILRANILNFWLSLVIEQTGRARKSVRVGWRLSDLKNKKHVSQNFMFA